MAEPLFLPSSGIGSSPVSFPGYFPRAVLPALFPACFLGDPLDGLLRNFPAVLWAVFPSVFPLTVLPALLPASSSSTLSRYSSCHFFPKHFLDLFPRLTFFFYSYPPVFSFRWFIFLSASFSAYPFCIFLFRPARPLFCNLAHLTLLAPSLAHSATFPASPRCIFLPPPILSPLSSLASSRVPFSCRFHAASVFFRLRFPVFRPSPVPAFQAPRTIFRAAHPRYPRCNPN